MLAVILPNGQAIAAPQHRPRPDIPDTKVVPSTSVLGIISGGLSGTYIRIATDMAAVFDSRVPEMRILPIVGKGSLQNISDILNVRDVDVGIVQSDVLSFLRGQAGLAGLEQSIAYLAKLYDEEIHVLARPEIGSIKDLSGKAVNVDTKGSGTSLTASVIFDALGAKPKLVYDDQEAALAKLKRGEIAALVYVAGKPARLFAETDLGGLHLLPIPLSTTLLETYLPSRFDHADYPNLVPEGQAVETVAVGAVMAVYNWPRGSERYTRLAHFVDALFDNLPALQAPPHHPKWRQVSLSAQVPGWTRFPAAQIWIARQGSAEASHGAGREPPARAAALPTARAAPPQAPAPSPRRDAAERVVASLPVNIRSGPDSNASVVRTWPTGTALTVFARRAGWLQVGDGEPWGWVYAGLVSPSRH